MGHVEAASGGAAKSVPLSCTGSSTRGERAAGHQRYSDQEGVSGGGCWDRGMLREG